MRALRRAKQLFVRKPKPCLYWNDTHLKVSLPERLPGCHHDVLLHHIWATGQDKMRIVKTGLLTLLPDLQVFLDVDDMEDIGDFEGYVARTSSHLVYCSKGFFDSKGAMRGLVAAVKQKKPIIALVNFDENDGGQSLDAVKASLVAADTKYDEWGFAGDTPTGAALYDAFFEHEPIEWQGVAMQPDMMRRIIERLVPDATDKTYVCEKV